MGLQLRKIKGQNIILFNFYLILTIQLIFNWQLTSCNNHTNLWKLVLLMVLYGRLMGDELTHNNKITRRNSLLLRVVSSLVLLSLSIAMISLLISNSSDFDKNPCFHNRIEYVVEVILSFVIIFKDIVYIISRKSQLLSIHEQA